jgi:histidine triad (HIT) family protein
MHECLFCAIINRTADARILFEDNWIIVFKNIAEYAPVHLLIAPKRHMEQFQLLQDGPLISHIMYKVSMLTKKLCPNGFRLVMNQGTDGHQSQLHGHVQLLGGRFLGMNYVSEPDSRSEARRFMEKARVLIHQVSEIYPEDRAVLLHKALVENLLGNYAAARDIFQEVICLYPADAAGYDGLAETSARLGDRITSINALEKLFTLIPPTRETLLLMFELHPKKAVDMWERHRLNIPVLLAAAGRAKGEHNLLLQALEKKDDDRSSFRAEDLAAKAFIARSIGMNGEAFARDALSCLGDVSPIRRLFLVDDLRFVEKTVFFKTIRKYYGR